MTEAHALYYPELEFEPPRPTPQTAWQGLAGMVVNIRWLDPTIDEGESYRVLLADSEFVLLQPMDEGRSANERLCVRLADIDHGRRRG